MSTSKQTIYNLFRFLEDKRGKKIPLRVKLIYDPESITPEELNVKGDLDLNYTNIKSLPSGLRVGGYLDLNCTFITSIPNNLEVGGALYLWRTPISKKYTKEQLRQMLPNVEGNIYV